MLLEKDMTHKTTNWILTPHWKKVFCGQNIFDGPHLIIVHRGYDNNGAADGSVLHHVNCVHRLHEPRGVLVRSRDVDIHQGGGVSVWIIRLSRLQHKDDLHMAKNKSNLSCWIWEKYQWCAWIEFARKAAMEEDHGTLTLLKMKRSNFPYWRLGEGKNIVALMLRRHGATAWTYWFQGKQF